MNKEKNMKKIKMTVIAFGLAMVTINGWSRMR